MRAFDRSDLWFAIILAALFILAAMAFGPIFVGTASNPAFWVNIALILVISLARPAIDRLGAVPRFGAWFCFGFAAMGLFTTVRSEPFNLLVAAGVGLMLAVIDMVTEYFRAWKERRSLNERA